MICSQIGQKKAKKLNIPKNLDKNRRLLFMTNNFISKSCFGSKKVYFWTIYIRKNSNNKTYKIKHLHPNSATNLLHLSLNYVNVQNHQKTF